MASFILKGLITNDGIDKLKMASLVYEKEISGVVWKGPRLNNRKAFLYECKVSEEIRGGPAQRRNAPEVNTINI